MPPRRLPPASLVPRRATIGMANARVLPEPVLPRPSTSRPASVSGSVSIWIGKAVVLPSAARAVTRGWGTPSVLKVTSVIEGVFSGRAHAPCSVARGEFRPRGRRAKFVSRHSSGDGGEGSVLRRKKRIGALQVPPVYQGAARSAVPRARDGRAGPSSALMAGGGVAPRRGSGASSDSASRRLRSAPSLRRRLDRLRRPVRPRRRRSALVGPALRQARRPARSSASGVVGRVDRLRATGSVRRHPGSRPSDASTGSATGSASTPRSTGSATGSCAASDVDRLRHFGRLGDRLATASDAPVGIRRRSGRSRRGARGRCPARSRHARHRAPSTNSASGHARCRSHAVMIGVQTS